MYKYVVILYKNLIVNWTYVVADLQKTLNDLDAIDPELIEDADVKKELDKLRKKLIRKGKREFEDGSMLKALVEMIEIMGFSQKKAFMFLDSHYFSESKAKSFGLKLKKKMKAR